MVRSDEIVFGVVDYTFSAQGGAIIFAKVSDFFTLVDVAERL